MHKRQSMIVLLTPLHSFFVSWRVLQVQWPLHYEDFWKTVCEDLEKAFDELHGEITSELQLQL